MPEVPPREFKQDWPPARERKQIRIGMSVDQVVANFGTGIILSKNASDAECPSIRLLPTSAPTPDIVYKIIPMCPSIRLLPTSAPDLRTIFYICRRSVRRSGCCQLRHRRAYSNYAESFDSSVRRSGCCQLRHLIFLFTNNHVSLVSVDQVVANFGTAIFGADDKMLAKCPSIRLLPTSAPLSFSENFSCNVCVRRSGCCQLRHRGWCSETKRTGSVRRSGCCQLRHPACSGLPCWL